ncbi:MAG: hypothetical protein LBR73_00370 [Oscillospiraceae bacterium]|nr:hypothetical protein [Oscillospiraceae bacterium]
MADNVDALLSEIRDEIENSRKWGKQRLVDEKILDMLEDIRAALPRDLERARQVNLDRDRVLEQAKREGERLIHEAKQRIAEFENESSKKVLDIINNAKAQVKQKREEGEQIIAAAQAEAARLVAEHAIAAKAQEQAEAIVVDAHARAQEIEMAGAKRADEHIQKAQAWAANTRSQTETWFLGFAADTRAEIEAQLSRAEETLRAGTDSLRALRRQAEQALNEPVQYAS